MPHFRWLHEAYTRIPGKCASNGLCRAENWCWNALNPIWINDDSPSLVGSIKRSSRACSVDSQIDKRLWDMSWWSRRSAWENKKSVRENILNGIPRTPASDQCWRSQLWKQGCGRLFVLKRPWAKENEMRKYWNRLLSGRRGLTSGCLIFKLFWRI